MAKPAEPPIYKPEPGSLAERLLAHLLNAGGGDDVQLDRNAISELFSAPSARVHTELAAAVIAGALKRGVNPDGETVYSMGRGKVDLGLAKRKRTAPLQMDVAQIKLEKGVPMPRPTGTPTHWEVLLAKMEPGDSFALPASARSSLSKAARHYSLAHPGKRFTVRRMQDGVVRCWRLEDSTDAGRAAH